MSNPFRTQVRDEPEVPAAHVAFAMGSVSLFDSLFGERELERLHSVAELDLEPLTEVTSVRASETLARTDVLVTGWGAPRLDAAALDLMPRLRALVHTGGQAGWFVDSSAWQRGVQVSNAGEANAIPVVEYTVAVILLAGKRAFSASAAYRRDPQGFDRSMLVDSGNFGRVVGVVGASRIGRKVVAALQAHDLSVLVHDPYTPDAEIEMLGARPVSLDVLLRTSDIVSLHVPLNDSTRGMLGVRELDLLRPGSVLVNTARGAVVDQEALVQRLARGDIEACIDTTEPDVLPPGHPLLTSEHVFLTPHLAGSEGSEVRRLGRAATDEVVRAVLGQPFRFPEREPVPAARASGGGSDAA